MSLIKKAIEHNNIARVQRKKYESVKFPNGFQQFIDAMVASRLIESTYQRTASANGHLWNDNRKNGGILLETTIHPHVITEFAGTVIIEGVPEAIEKVEHLFVTHGVLYNKD